MTELVLTRHNELIDPLVRRLGLGDPGLPVPRRMGGRHDDHRRLLPPPRADCARSSCVCARAAGAQPRPPEPRACSRCSSTSSTSSTSGASTRPSRSRRRCRGAPGSCCSSTRCSPRSSCSGRRHSCGGSGRRSIALTALLAQPRVDARAGRDGRSCSASALGIYTGVLLSALGARPFWNSALLGPLFLVSGLSSAAAFTHLVARDRGRARAAGDDRQRAAGRRAVRAGPVPRRPAQLVAGARRRGPPGPRRSVHRRLLGARGRRRDRRSRW